MRVFARVANLVDLGCFVGARRSSEHFVVLDLIGFVVAGNLRLEVDLVELEFALVVELKADFVESVLAEPVTAEQEFDFEISSSVDIADSVVFVLGIVAVEFDREFVAEELQFVAAVDTADESDLEIVDAKYFDLDLLEKELIQEQLVVHVVMETKKCQ